MDVAFALDAVGNLLTWAGSSRAFSPAGQFRPPEAGEAEHNLYLVAISDRRYLGVVFADGVVLDEIQSVMSEWQKTLSLQSS